MAHKIAFVIVSSAVMSVVGAFMVFLVAFYDNLAISYPVVVLLFAALIAYSYRRIVREEKWRYVVIGLIGVISGIIASIPVVLIQRYAADIAFEAGPSMVIGSLPVPSYVHGILFLVLFVIPTFFFPVLDEGVKKPEKKEEPKEFKEIEEAVKEREQALAKQSKEEKASENHSGNDKKASDEKKKSG